jgi:hypothetical protein
MHGTQRFGSWIVSMTALLAMQAAPAAGQNTQRGAVVGGLTGAIAGGLIGDHNGEAGAGALIGGAIGAVTGGVIGNAQDKEDAYARYQVQQQAAVAMQQAVSTADVVAMCRNGLNETLIINQIRQRGVQRRLEVTDIISLHQQGVSENVISAMQQAPVGGPAVQVAAPVIVERYDVAPAYIVPGPRYYYYHHHHHRPRHHHFHAGYCW